MKSLLRPLALILALILVAAPFLSSCKPTVDKELQINISVLNGTTGFGAAALINDAISGQTDLNYQFTVESDASNITAGLINGSIDIAALPTNAAANLYNKTNGAIKIAAVNTLGVLYLMTGEGVEINSISDLYGKRVFCPAQNPAFIFEAICRANNLIPDENITIDTGYAQPADLRAALVTGAVDIAVLPEPMVTIARSANPSLITALDLTDEWEKVYGAGTLMQGCIVVRTEWAEAHEKELAEFLRDYRASIKFTNDEPESAAAYIVSTGVFAGKEAVAAKAIPNCNIVYIDSDEIADNLSIFFEKLYDINPNAVGGSIPDENIYYGKK